MARLLQSGTEATLRLVLLVLLSAGLMFVDHRYQHLETVRGVLAGAIAPLRYTVDLPATWLGWTSEHMTGHGDLIDRIHELERNNIELRARQQRLETLQAENRRLRALLESSAKREDRVRVAELLAVDLDPYRQQVVVNKGERDGVYRGQPLIDAHGVMGQIIHTSPITATALLISDPNHALPVQLNRNGLRTIASGTGEPDRLELLYIPNSADVRVGDLVVTSGLGGRFPPNYPVAIVVLVERRPGEPFARVVAEPRAQLDRSREVLLVWPEEGELPPATAAGERRRSVPAEQPEDLP